MRETGAADSFPEGLIAGRIAPSLYHPGMESLLTLSIGEFRAVELSLRLIVALIGMTSLLLLLGITCTAAHYRLPLIISGVALLGAAWFEAGVWMAWKEAFELAGTSYCVTGHLLGSEDRIIAWSLGVPAILFCFGMIQMPGGKAGGYLLEKLSAAALALAIFAPFSSTAALALVIYIGWLLCVHLPKQIKGIKLLMATRLAVGCIAPGVFLVFLGAFHLLPMGGIANGVLVRGEIIRGLIDLFSLVIPAVIFLIGALKLSDQEAVAN